MKLYRAVKPEFPRILSGCRRSIRFVVIGIIGCGLFLNAQLPAWSQQQPDLTPSYLKKLSIEELLDLEVMSVSKRSEKLSETASAIQVITANDVKRSGAQNLTDALRLAPNLQVAQLNSYSWVVGARGFNGNFANKLLVMIDGRSVYTPLFAGVLWDVQNVLLEDLERIEVVSGPGGTLWGANAVNGVINVITKSAAETQGLYVSGGGGSFLQDWGAVRYGDRIGSNLFYRVYAQQFDYNHTFLPGGQPAADAWAMTQGGFRMDYLPSEANTLTLQGDFYGGSERTSPSESSVNGQNVLGRWTHTFSEDSDLSLQVYWDRTWRRDVPSAISDELNTYDFDFQHRFLLTDWNTIVWGFGYRYMDQDTPTSTTVVGFVPQRRKLNLFSGFVQDEMTLVPDRVKFIVGTKMEHNDFTGFEIQPSARLAWTPTDQQTFWGAISRAVRSPGRFDVDYHIPKSPPYIIAGGPGFESEELIAYEVGYRVQPMSQLSLSLAAFYNTYDDIYNVQVLSFPVTIENGVEGESWGVEVSGTYQPLERWRLRGGYTYFEKELRGKPGHFATGIPALGNDPRHQVMLQSILDLPAHFQLDVVARYVDALPNPQVSDYLTFDVRLAWAYKQIELSVVGRNLWEPRHPEYGTQQEIPRSVFGQVTFRW